MPFLRAALIGKEKREEAGILPQIVVVEEAQPEVIEAVTESESLPEVEETVETTESLPDVEEAAPDTEDATEREEAVAESENLQEAEQLAETTESLPDVEEPVNATEDATEVEEPVDESEELPEVEQLDTTTETLPEVEELAHDTEEATDVEEAITESEELPEIEQLEGTTEEATDVETLPEVDEPAPDTEETADVEEPAPESEELPEPPHDDSETGTAGQPQPQLPPEITEALTDNTPPAPSNKDYSGDSLDYDFTSGERYVDKVSTKTEFDKMLDELSAISKDLLAHEVEKFALKFTGKFTENNDKAESDAKKFEAFLGGYITNAAMILYDNGYTDAALKQLEQAKDVISARKRLEEETLAIKTRVEQEDASVDLSDILGLFGD